MDSPLPGQTGLHWLTRQSFLDTLLFPDKLAQPYLLKTWQVPTLEKSQYIYSSLNSPNYPRHHLGVHLLVIVMQEGFPR